MSYINAKKEYSGTGAQVAIPLNRWADPDYSVRVDIGGTGTYTVQGTLDQINREGVTAGWFDITGLISLTADTAQNIVNTPLEAIRLSVAANSTTISFHVMQNA